MEQSRAFGKLFLQSVQKAMRSASLQVSNTECSKGIDAGLAGSSDASAFLHQLHVGRLLLIDSVCIFTAVIQGIRSL